jgi:hypothetical protein
MRYVVGQPAGMMIALRRYLPGELFGRIYFEFLPGRLTGLRRAWLKVVGYPNRLSGDPSIAALTYDG